MSVKGKYLNPKADLTFKLIFGEHADLMKSFLNALLPLEAGREIESVVYANPELIPENPGKKKGGVQRLPSVFGGYLFPKPQVSPPMKSLPCKFSA